MSESHIVVPRLTVRSLLVPFATGIFAAWVTVGAVLGVVMMLGFLRTYSPAGRRLFGLAAFGNSVLFAAAFGAVATIIACLGLPLVVRLYERSQRAQAAAASRSPAA